MESKHILFFLLENLHYFSVLSLYLLSTSCLPPSPPHWEVMDRPFQKKKHYAQTDSHLTLKRSLARILPDGEERIESGAVRVGSLKDHLVLSTGLIM